MKVRWHNIYVKDHVYAEKKNEQTAICHIMWGGKLCGSVSNIGDQKDSKKNNTTLLTLYSYLSR